MRQLASWSCTRLSPSKVCVADVNVKIQSHRAAQKWKLKQYRPIQGYCYKAFILLAVIDEKSYILVYAWWTSCFHNVCLFFYSYGSGGNNSQKVFEDTSDILTDTAYWATAWKRYPLAFPSARGGGKLWSIQKWHLKPLSLKYPILCWNIPIPLWSTPLNPLLPVGLPCWITQIVRHRLCFVPHHFQCEQGCSHVCPVIDRRTGLVKHVLYYHPGSHKMGLAFLFSLTFIWSPIYTLNFTCTPSLKKETLCIDDGVWRAGIYEFYVQGLCSHPRVKATQIQAL